MSMGRNAAIGPPATLGDVRWLDAHWLLASCKTCAHETIVDVEALPDFVPLSWFAEQFICERYAGVEAYILPSWVGESRNALVSRDDFETPALLSTP
jgi:hypothetical protein